MKLIMFTVIALTLSAVANDDLIKTTTCKTNRVGIVTVDTYTRMGVTNLRVKTMVKNETTRIQNVYLNGKLVMDIWDMGDGLTISAKAQSDCDVGTHFSEEGLLECVNLMDTNLVTLDHFIVTNNVLFPISSDEIRKANDITVDVKALFDPQNVKTNTPENFAAQAVEIANKHQDK